MTEREAILQRHSVRAYQDKKIEAEKVAQIQEKITELNAAGNLCLAFIEDAGRTYGKLLNRLTGIASAPSIVACVGPDAEDLDQRVGYYGQQLVLFLQQLGLNTCWTGTFDRNNAPVEVASGERLVIAIAVGYGQTSGKIRKSKTPIQVAPQYETAPEWFQSGVELALLAPTAINQQKFEIRLNEDESVEFVDKGGILSQVDLGIIKYHFEVGAERK